MKAIAPELAVMVTGLLLLAVGLAAWVGWEKAAVLVGAVLLVLGTWSAASAQSDKGKH